MSAADEIESVAATLFRKNTDKISCRNLAKTAMLATLNAIREPTTNQFAELALTTDGRLGPTEEWKAMIDAKKAEIEAA